MNISFRYFAHLRELLGRDRDCLSLPQGARPQDILPLILPDPTAAQKWIPFLKVAINATYAALDSPLQDGDEVTFIPPVAGG